MGKASPRALMNRLFQFGRLARGLVHDLEAVEPIDATQEGS